MLPPAGRGFGGTLDLQLVQRLLETGRIRRSQSSGTSCFCAETFASTAKSGPVLQPMSVRGKLLCPKAYACALVVGVLVYVPRYQTGKSGCGLHPGNGMHT